MKPFGKENGGEKFDFTKMFRKSAPVETIKDDYDETERTLSDADAHRDVSYELPSNIKQIWIAYLTQMKRFTKEKTVWGLLVLLALIPIIYIVLINNLMEVENSHVTNIYISTCLMAMPIISMFICTTVCGSMLPREYNERTIYFSLPLPMSRFAFYIGKFFAGLTLCWGVITAAYGISILMALMGGTDATYSGPLFKSLLVMMASTFFFCAFTYMMSAHSKRGSSMRAILFLAIALPALIILVKFLPNVEALSSFKEPLSALGDLLLYLPVAGPDLAMASLGQPVISAMFNMNCLSLLAFGQLMTPITMDMNAIVMILTSRVLGIACLAGGFFIIRRRDM